jgi:deoxyribose-phosphate aldolase
VSDSRSAREGPASRIDHSSLRADATEESIRDLRAEATTTVPRIEAGADRIGTGSVVAIVGGLA